MVQRYIAALLILMLLGVVTPAYAEEYVNPRLLPRRTQPLSTAPATLASTRFRPSGATYSRAAGRFALALPQSGQESPPQSGEPQPAQQSSKRSLTTAGKVLKWVGIGLMAEGGLTIGVGEAVYKGNGCASGYGNSCILDNSDLRNVYRGIGGASIGVGIVLMLVGLSKKE